MFIQVYLQINTQSLYDLRRIMSKEVMLSMPRYVYFLRKMWVTVL